MVYIVRMLYPTLYYSDNMVIYFITWYDMLFYVCI